MNTISAMIEEVYTSTNGVTGITYAWFMEGSGVMLVKTEWSETDLYTTRWGFDTTAEFSQYLEGQHSMHVANGWTHEVFS